MTPDPVAPSAVRPQVILLPGGSQAGERTRRAVVAHGLTCGVPAEAQDGWWWVMRAGCWPFAVPSPVASASGRPTMLIGMARPADPDALCDPSVDTWHAWQRASGGDADDMPVPGLPAAVLLDPRSMTRCRELIATGRSLSAAVSDLLADASIRRLWWHGADVVEDQRVRVVQVITSLQRGGAERMVLGLHVAIARERLAMHLVVAGEPTRGAFPLPAGAITCADAGSRSQRMGEAAFIAARAGADVVHAHLLTGEDLTAFTERGLPLLITVHNARAGWPVGLEHITAGCLLVACSRRVEDDLAQALPQVKRRTVWNGIDANEVAPDPGRLQRGRALRTRLGIASGDAVLLALANPRAQKRLEAIPAMIPPLQRATGRRIHLLLAGEAGVGPGAAEAEEHFALAVLEHGVCEVVHRLGMVDDVADVLSAADVLVSPSAWEGLSLAHLEALAAGLPVVASEVGGAAEVARHHQRLHLIAPDADTDRWVATLARVLADPPPRTMALAPSFTLAAMASGYARLYPRVAAWSAPRPEPTGFWLVTNNLSTGGAQSSARRLLRQLHRDGTTVRCAVLQEHDAQPTPGRQDLLGAGIPVLVIPPPEILDAEASVARLAAAIERDPPRAVLLWNVMPGHKVLIAESLLDVPVWDVSPGEMNFASLDRLFQRVPTGVPLRDVHDYGARLAGSVVKFHGEAERAAQAFRRPVQVIANGVPMPERSTARTATDTLVFGTSARLSPDKRVMDLLDALRLASPRLPAWELRVAGGPDGDPAYAQELRRAARGLPVHFLGEVQDGQRFLADLDLFVLIAEPAGCPNASLEAMAHGLPVVATAVGGMPEQITSGIDGLLVPPRDADALAEALVLAATDARLRARWGAAARQRIRDHFTVERMAADYRRICLREPEAERLTPP